MTRGRRRAPSGSGSPEGRWGISPDCADAYVLLAEAAQSPDEALDLYAQGMAAGERALGPRAFEEKAGSFWSFLETRPYMRARHGLAECLAAKGRPKEAIEHYRDMLRLNPRDNQGNRHALLGLLLAVGNVSAAREMLDKYREDGSAAWLYGRSLLAFRTQGDSSAARKLLAEARAMNPYVPVYLLGLTPLPEHPPATFGWGDEAEAVDLAYGQMDAWQATRGALDWLARHSR